MVSRSLACLVCVAGLFGPATARADQSFSQTIGHNSALATFSVSGTTLTVTLWNTSTVDVGVPSDVLTGVFFNISNFDGELTRQSAVLTSPAGTPVLFSSGTTQPGLGYNSDAALGDVGSEAGYRAGSSSHGSSGSGDNDSDDSGHDSDSDDSDSDGGGGDDGVGNHAIAVVGMDDFMGVNTRFDADNSHNLQGPHSLGGIDFGLVNATYSGGGNAPINGPNALVRTGITFSFSGFTGSESDIGNVSFNYGTGFNPVSIPAPGAAALGMMGFGLVGWVRRRFT